MKRTKKVDKFLGKAIVCLQKEGERNSLTLIKEKKQEGMSFHLNVGTDNRVQGISLTRDEFLYFANEIKDFVGEITLKNDADEKEKLMALLEPQELQARNYFGLDYFEKSVGGVVWKNTKTKNNVVLKGKFKFKDKDYDIKIMVDKEGIENPRAEISNKELFDFGEIIRDEKSLKYWVENR